jgi:DNA polymerase-3 subunit epsilon
MREFVFDTETTGLNPQTGDRVVEIGCVELMNHIPSGEKYHMYFNPERSMPAEAALVHGLEDSFLADKPLFANECDGLIDFLGDAVLIAHNASFDMGFLNAELVRAGRPPISDNRVIDTLTLARRRHPGSPASLDALCARYQINTSRREVHGGLLDAELLAEVYIELIGGRQATLVLGSEPTVPTVSPARHAPVIATRPVARVFTLAADELAAHADAMKTLGPKSIWAGYLSGGTEGAEPLS